MDSRLAEFHELGATVIAVIGETPEHLAKTLGDNPLGFPVLFDEDLKTASAFGLVYKLSPELENIYLQFGLDIGQANGMAEAMLPVPGTYVIGKDREVLYSYLDVDHTTRAEPADLLTAVEKYNEQDQPAGK